MLLHAEKKLCFPLSLHFILPSKVDDMQAYQKFQLNFLLIKGFIDFLFFLWDIHPVLINMVTTLKAPVTSYYQ